jgi:hypothetical protein
MSNIKKKKKIEPDDPEQSARFIEMAKKIKADDDKELFEEACRTVIKPKTQKASKPTEPSSA